jgi:hypothetical protein
MSKQVKGGNVVQRFEKIRLVVSVELLKAKSMPEPLKPSIRLVLRTG